jgi:hypothetical protein
MMIDLETDAPKGSTPDQSKAYWGGVIVMVHARNLSDIDLRLLVGILRDELKRRAAGGNRE